MALPRPNSGLRPSTSRAPVRDLERKPAKRSTKEAEEWSEPDPRGYDHYDSPQRSSSAEVVPYKETTSKRKGGRSKGVIDVSPDASPRMPKLKTGRRYSEENYSMVKANMDTINELLEIDEADNAISAARKRMMQSILHKIGLVEELITDTKGAKGIYQLNTLITSFRELSADLQAQADRAGMGEAIVNDIVVPIIKTLAMDIMIDNARVTQELDRLVADERLRAKVNTLVKSSRDATVAMLDKHYQSMREQIVQSLAR